MTASNVQIPTIAITISSTSQQEKRALQQDETSTADAAETKSIRSIASQPPAYPEETLACPTPAYLTSPRPTASASSESLPTYDHVKVDMPPNYPYLKMTPDAPFDLIPIEPQTPWPITKKLYIAGFLLWPLWYIGVGFSLFGKDITTRRWGRRCAWNALIVTVILTYLLVAFFKTGGQFGF